MTSHAEAAQNPADNYSAREPFRVAWPEPVLSAIRKEDFLRQEIREIHEEPSLSEPVAVEEKAEVQITPPEPSGIENDTAKKANQPEVADDNHPTAVAEQSEIIKPQPSKRATLAPVPPVEAPSFEVMAEDLPPAEEEGSDTFEETDPQRFNLHVPDDVAAKIYEIPLVGVDDETAGAEAPQPVAALELSDIILADFQATEVKPEAGTAEGVIPIGYGEGIIEGSAQPERIINFFEDRIVLLEPAAAKAAAETLEEINEIIQLLAETYTGEAAVVELKEKLEMSCVQLLDQLGIAYSDEDLKALMVALTKVELDLEIMPANEEKGFLHDLLHEAKSDDGLAGVLTDNPLQLIRYLAASPGTLGSLALALIRAK